ncbi:hypothetical protein OTU49_010082 [Cherax quadricarinatus]|uniref:Uncharacterized protein n=1 Tax=Cherax quadricarinatus TaxID=27406 RepID=A0AAW0WGA9_CHEQU
MATLSPLLALAVMPFNLWAYSKRWPDQELQLPYFNIVLSLVFVIVPVVVGMFVRQYIRKWALCISKVRLESLTGNVATPDQCRTHRQDQNYMLDQRRAQSQCGIKVQHSPQDHCGPPCHYCALEHCSSKVQWDPQDHFSGQDNCDSQDHFGPHRYKQGPCDKEETMRFLSYQPALQADQVGEIPPPWTPMSHRSQFVPLEQSPDARVMSPTIKNSTNYWSQDHDNVNCASSFSRRLESQTSPSDLPHSPYCDSDFDNNVFPEDLLEWACGYDSDSPGSPSLSNKGVPNMFPVTENDFLSEEDSPLPYGSPVASYRRFQDYVMESAENEGSGGGRPDTPGRRSSSENPRLSNPESGLSGSPSSSPVFGFYHNGVRLGQTRQFSTFGRK